METVLDTESNRNHGHTREARVGDKEFEFTTVTFDDPRVTAAQVAMAVGKHPVEDHVVLVVTKTGELETLRPTETTELAKDGSTMLFVVKGDLTFRFFVEGLAMEWPFRTLLAWQIKSLAGAGGDQALVLERPGVDEEFDDDDEVEIGESGTERFKLRKRKRTVTVRYGETSFELERGVYSTEQFIALFGVPAGYLLDFVEQSGVFREMAAGERLKVKDGMEFASHPPVGQSS